MKSTLLVIALFLAAVPLWGFAPDGKKSGHYAKLLYTSGELYGPDKDPTPDLTSMGTSTPSSGLNGLGYAALGAGIIVGGFELLESRQHSDDKHPSVPELPPFVACVGMGAVLIRRRTRRSA